jgi:phage terminase large subunit-like protein
VRDACRRHLRDLQDGPARGLVWDTHELGETIRFYSEILRLNGGQFEGKPFILEPSQVFIVGSLFAWKRADGFRRFRGAYIEMGKGNGKSPLVAGAGLKMLVADREPRAEIYAAATKKDQAAILFRDAVAMVDQSPELDAALRRSGGKGMEWNIADLSSGSFFRTVASDDAQSGPRPHCAILDEVHEHKTGMMVEMMRAGFKFRRQPMLLMITNSGTDRNSVCWEKHQYATEVCAGTREDDEFFGYVCGLDEDDDPFHDESCWPKANPLLDVSVTREFLRGQVREALGMPSKESSVRRLHFCQWVESDNPIIGSEVWLAAAEDYHDDLLLGRKCWGGLDLSSTTDLTAFVLLFAPSEADPKWRQKSWFWLPEQNLDDKAHKDRVPYRVWRSAGWLTATSGAAVNKLFVLSHLVACCERYDVQAIGYDRWRIEDFKAMIEQEGVELPLEPFGQGFQSMAPALDEYERLLVNRELRHDRNPIMTWNAASAVAEKDAAGNRKPTKERSTGRIDGFVAAVMAAGLAIKPVDAPTYQVMIV